MKAKAEIKFYYDSEETAERVAYLLEVDNRAAPRNLKLMTSAKGKKVITEFEHEKLNTFLATIDDLLFTERLVADLLPMGRR
jgi:hypothetical protein